MSGLSGAAVTDAAVSLRADRGRLFVLLLGTITLACKEPSPTPSSVTPSTSAFVAPTPAVPAGPWFVGAWQGSYSSQPFEPTVPVPEAGEKAWADAANNTQGIGAGTLSVSVDAAGQAVGSAQGPLGAATLSGHAEGERLVLKLYPASDPITGFSGTVTVHNTGPGAATGQLRASTGNSLIIRSGNVSLRKAP